MRQIATFSNYSKAKKIGEYLYTQKIDNQLRQEGQEWHLWIYDDDKIDAAQKILDDFYQSPQDKRFDKATEARIKLRQEDREEKRTRNKFVDVRTQWHRQSAQTAYLTWSLIGISVVVALISDLGSDKALIQHLVTFFPYIREGQIWRLVTPIFIHFGILHLVFNMLWLRDLGSMVENKQSPWFLAIFVLVIAIASNIAQYFFSGTNFGGMSGVVYGLLGYIWIRGKFDPGSGYFLHPSTVNMMIIWFFVCLVGIIEHVANAAHGVGLVGGMLWGYLASRLFSKS
ncbi:MAG: rhomboid family intramembrane serine protease [Deltaproteobacteria bacterium]|nr:rhomboid family intramembrane serine protease [Deltaproteobacteria bacterium]